MEEILRKIHAKLNTGQVRTTVHFLERLHQRDISVEQVIESIENGKIIKEYPDEKPSPCYLILGECAELGVLHTVVGLEEVLWLITSYQPDIAKWSEDFTVKKE